MKQSISIKELEKNLISSINTKPKKYICIYNNNNNNKANNNLTVKKSNNTLLNSTKDTNNTISTKNNNNNTNTNKVRRSSNINSQLKLKNNLSNMKNNVNSSNTTKTNTKPTKTSKLPITKPSNIIIKDMNIVNNADFEITKKIRNQNIKNMSNIYKKSYIKQHYKFTTISPLYKNQNQNQNLNQNPYSNATDNSFNEEELDFFSNKKRINRNSRLNFTTKNEAEYNKLRTLRTSYSSIRKNNMELELSFDVLSKKLHVLNVKNYKQQQKINLNKSKSTNQLNMKDRIIHDNNILQKSKLIHNDSMQDLLKSNAKKREKELSVIKNYRKIESMKNLHAGKALFERRKEIFNFVIEKQEEENTKKVIKVMKIRKERKDIEKKTESYQFNKLKKYSNEMYSKLKEVRMKKIEFNSMMDKFSSIENNLVGYLKKITEEYNVGMNMDKNLQQQDIDSKSKSNNVMYNEKITGNVTQNNLDNANSKENNTNNTNSRSNKFKKVAFI